MKRKLISSLLCLCMLFSLLPAAAFAGEDGADETQGETGTSAVEPSFTAATTTDQFAGKTASDVQSGTMDIKKGTDEKYAVSGVTLKHITGWTAFNTVLTEEQSGYYLAIAVPGTAGDAKIAGMILPGKDADGQATTKEYTGETLSGAFTDGGNTKCNIFIHMGATKEAVQAKTFNIQLKYGNEQNYTTYTFSCAGVNVEEPAITITTAPLHDQSGRVADNDLCTGYSVTQPDKDNKISVSASNVRLHKNADSPASYGYWTGVQFKAPDGYTVQYKMGDMTSWAKDVDDGSYVSLYSDFDVLTGDKTRKITIGLFKGDNQIGSETEYTIDFSGVTKKTSTATLGYTAVADTNVVEDCAPETIWAEFDEPLRPGWLWFDITDPDGVVYGIAGSSAELSSGKLPTKQAWSFQNKGQFEAWPKDADGNDVALGVKTGEYTVVGYYVGDTQPEQRPANLTSLTKIVDGKVSVVAPVEGVEIAAPAAPVVDVSGVNEADVETVTNALKNVATTEESKTVLQNAANTSASSTSTKPAYSKDTAATELNKLDNISDVAAEDVSIVYQPYLDVKASAYDGTAKTLTVDITPKCHVLATTEKTFTDLKFDQESGNNAVKLGTEDLTVTTPIEMQIGLPKDFVTKGDAYPPVYVQHKGYEYTAAVTEVKENEIVTGLLATFTNPHGFSEFTVTATSQTVAKIGDTSYTTLKDAVEAAMDGDTITLVKVPENTNISATIDSNKTIKFAIGAPLTDETTVTINGIEIVIPKTGTVEKVFTKTETPAPPPSSSGGSSGGVSSNVTVSSASNGKVTVTPTAPSKGATVTINLTPDSGYQVGSVTVTDKDGNAVELTKVSDTQYTFTMPDGKVTVRATFTQVEAPSSTGFTDVAAGAYYADAVKWAVDKGITNGLTATTFGPDNSCTRGQMVTFLWRAAGSPAATGTNSFSDVASGEYYYDAVLWAVEKGITNGTSATTFSPNATVNRGQTVTFLYRYAGSPAATGSSSFTDVTDGAYYADAVKWAVAEEITNGTSATTFSPASNCTRGQIVTFMYRQMAE